jgi:hypothetical protein
MTLSFARLTPMLRHFLGQLAVGRQHARLDLKAMSARDIADLNLPPELKGRLLARRDAGRVLGEF